MRLFVIRVIVVLTALTGVNYIVWRWGFSLNWDAWWIAVPLVAAETYALIDMLLFGFTVWRSRERPRPEAPEDGLGVDVFITTYNEPVDLVLETARAAAAIRYPHSTWILDDGARPEMRAAAASIGVGYLERTEDWRDRPRHAKAGNLNNALMATDGEFLLILDADQVPEPQILDATLGYFRDPRVALVQTPQRFSNIATGDPLGSQAPLFYGPIQQGKDGWNAAFFCGSNAVLRRDALMRLGLVGYAAEMERTTVAALRRARAVVRRSLRDRRTADPVLRAGLVEVGAAVDEARRALRARESLDTVTYRLQQRVDAVSRGMVDHDVDLMRRDLEAIRDMELAAAVPAGDAPPATPPLPLDPDRAVAALATRELSPLGAVESVQTVLRMIDLDRAGEAQPIMPLATISVTEDMATSMRLHALGYASVYHHEILANGLAPDDLGTMLKQRLRWAQGTIQVLLRENPLFLTGLSLPQRLLYFATMWSYFTGFAALVFFAAPIVFLVLGVLPVSTTALEFFLRFLPFLVINQVLFLVVGRGIPTWRGQQYNLALFPIWIRAVVTGCANVWFGRPLGFVVTEKARQAVGDVGRLLWPQILVAVLLVLASIVGVYRLVTLGEEPLGTGVNLVWVVYDLVILSVLVGAARYRGYRPEEGD